MTKMVWTSSGWRQLDESDLVSGDRSSLKFCRDCKYHEEWDNERWTTDRHRCNRERERAPEAVKYDPVTGDVIKPVIENCYANRRDASRCGPDGAWWEPTDS